MASKDRDWWAWGVLLCVFVLVLPAAGAEPASASYRIEVGDAGGSGVAIAPRLVVTNSHVVGGRLVDDVRLCDAWGRWRQGRAVAVDRTADVALIHVRDPLPAVAELGDDPSPGQRLQLLGWGPDRRLKQGRGQLLGPRGSRGGSVPVLETAIHSEPGDSGGGIFDASGRLVALNWGGDPSTGFSASTPVSYVKKLGETWATSVYPRERWQEFQCFGGACGGGGGISLNAGSGRGVAPPKWPVAPPPEPISNGPVQAPSPSVDLPRPVQQPVDTDSLVDRLAEKLAADARFRGPAGPAGPPGKDGKDGADANEDRIVAAVLERIDYDAIAAKVPKPSTGTASQEVHYVVVGSEETADWQHLQQSVRYAQARYQGISVAAPPANYTGLLPALVKYTNSVPQYVARGTRDVDQALAALAKGVSP